MSKIIKPVEYRPVLDKIQTEKGIKLIKDFFQQNLSTELRLRRVTCPLFVLQGLGINDDLNGVERPVTFPIKDLGDKRAEVVHSLAKWKRLTLAELNIEPGYGIYTDMDAIRADEELDRTEYLTCESYPELKAFLPREITFIHSEDLLQMYPDKTPKEREDLICRKYGAVFLIGIGAKLTNGEKHDGRAPDYDDWSTPNEDGKIGLNGDILIWYPILNRSFELSSMGIRVDIDAMKRQLQLEGKQERAELYFHRKLLNGELPLTIGGGIGQSRLCMVMLHKAHIGEIQASIWPEEMRSECLKLNMPLI